MSFQHIKERDLVTLHRACERAVLSFESRVACTALIVEPDFGDSEVLFKAEFREWRIKYVAAFSKLIDSRFPKIAGALVGATMAGEWLESGAPGARTDKERAAFVLKYGGEP